MGSAFGFDPATLARSEGPGRPGGFRAEGVQVKTYGELARGAVEQQRFDEGLYFAYSRAPAGGLAACPQSSSTSRKSRGSSVLPAKRTRLPVITSVPAISPPRSSFPLRLSRLAMKR